MSIIAITGATGYLGSHIINHLLDKSLIAASRIIATCREPSNASALADRGVSVRQGTFHDPDSMTTAFKGANTVLVISANEVGGIGHELTANAIRAAKDAGVTKIFYTSHTGVKKNSRFFPGHGHWLAEQELGKSGLEWTSLRNGFYMWSTDFMYGNPLESGTITGPPDGKVSWVDRDDLAEGIAFILAGKYDTNRVNHLDLVNTSSWDMADAARIISKMTGKEIKRVEVEEGTLVKELTAAGVPERMAVFRVGAVAAMKDGDFGKTDEVLEGILGRKCKTLEEYLQEKYSQALASGEVH